MVNIKDEFGLRPIWDAVLEIYDEFTKVCDRHKLRYYVTDGNALGAIRHKGFIPWDDDFDVSMPRPDYEKFIEICDKELPPHLKFVYWKNTKGYYHLFGKIQDVRAERVCAIERQVGHMMSNGLFIDIFPIEGYPTSKWDVFCIKLENLVLKPLSRYRLRAYSTQTRRGKVAWIIGAVLSPFVPFWKDFDSMMGKLDANLKRFPFETSEMTGRACSRINVLYRPPVPRKIWGDGAMAEYYDRFVRLPSDWDSHLKSEFGDYMKMPPKECQKPTHTYDFRCPWWLGPDMKNEHSK